MAERVKAMRAIWTQEVAEFHGAFVDFAPMMAFPKPVQVPAPPVLVGGVGPNALRRVVDFGDGWLPTALPPDDLRARVDALRVLAKDAGRPDPTVTVFGAPADPNVVAAYEEIGAERVLILLPDGDPAETRRAMDDASTVLH
jgi:alkanesulfonate monooxygenase SsuD/methylene tetrahydromethanopterin reductase-like flavin-dependent oxidoreductase (luciferase family)